MNTAAMSEIEPGNVLQVSTSLSIFTQSPQVCFGQTVAAGWLREQVLGGGRTLAASGWHVRACVRARGARSQADDAALRAMRDAAVRACERTGVVCATQRRLLASVRRAVALERTARRHDRSYGAPSRSSVRARARTHGSVAVLHRLQRRCGLGCRSNNSPCLILAMGRKADSETCEVALYWVSLLLAAICGWFSDDISKLVQFLGCHV